VITLLHKPAVERLSLTDTPHTSGDRIQGQEEDNEDDVLHSERRNARPTGQEGSGCIRSREGLPGHIP
jgi:hypothetical protein